MEKTNRNRQEFFSDWRRRVWPSNGRCKLNTSRPRLYRYLSVFASDGLLGSDKSVAEIAAECGFCDQSAFAQHFRKHIGETPATFRRRRIRSQTK